MADIPENYSPGFILTLKLQGGYSVNKIEAWYWGNIQLVANLLPKSTVQYDDVKCKWLTVDPFPLPKNIKQDYSSRLVIVMPGLDKPIYAKPSGFYLDKDLQHSSGRSLYHVFNNGSAHGCRNLSNRGYAWFCLMLKRWQPSYNVIDGDNYATVINTIFQQLDTV